MARLLVRFKSGDFERKGYLGDEIRDLLPKVREIHNDAFHFFYELAEYAQKRFTQLTSSPAGSRQKMLAIAFFAKILAGTQAGCILSNHGLAVDARTVLRSALDALFLLRKTVKEPGFSKRYYDADDLKRLNRMKEYFKQTRDHETVDSIQGRIDEDGLKKLENIEKLAASVGMSDQYKRLYRIFCDDAHGNPRSLQRPALPSGDLDWGPQFGYAPADVLVGSYLLLVALWQLESLSDLKSETELHAFRERLTAMVPKYLPSEKSS